MTNVAAVKKAVGALKKGLGESFLQSADSNTLARIVQVKGSASTASVTGRG